MERPTPAERVRNPRANRHAHHGCDGEAGKHPCDELRAVLFSCYIGRVRHGNGHQRAGHQRDEDSRHYEHAIIRRERAQHIADKKHPNQRQMRGKTRKTSRQCRSERRDRRIHEREQRHKIADRHLRHLQASRDIRQNANDNELAHAQHETQRDQHNHRQIEKPFLRHITLRHTLLLHSPSNSPRLAKLALSLKLLTSID